MAELMAYREPVWAALAAIGGGAGVGLAAAGAGGLARGAGRWTVRHGRVLACAAGVGFFAWFAVYALLRHWSLRSGSSDLAWETQVLHNIAFTGLPFSSVGWYEGTYFQSHVSLIYYALAPFYRLYPAPETFIVLQALLLAAGAPLAFGYAHAATRSRAAGLLATAAYVLHPAIQGMAVFDVHSSPLGLPLVLGAAWAFVARRPALGWTLALAAMACREEMTLVAIPLAAALWAPGRRRTSIALIAAGVAGYLLIAGLLMTLCGGHPNGSYYPLFQDEQGRIGAVQILTKLVSAPVETIAHFLSEPKRVFLAVMLLPAGLVALCDWRMAAAAFPGLVITLAASTPGHFIPGYQYGTLLVAAIVLVFPLGWRRLAAVRRRIRGGHLALPLGLLGCAIAACTLWGATSAAGFAVDYVEPRGGAGTYLGQLGWERHWPFRPAEVEDVRRLRALVPPDARVAATFYLAPHFSSRRWVCPVESEHAWKAEYVVIDPGRLLERDRRGLSALGLMNGKLPVTEAGGYTRVGAAGRLVLLRRVQPGVPEAGGGAQPLVEHDAARDSERPQAVCGRGRIGRAACVRPKCGYSGGAGNKV